MQCTRRQPIVLVRGEGTRVWDETGKYLSTIIFICPGIEHDTFGTNAWLHMGKI
jgi:acetylornithine/succinyldiaminopimelate/putrescine aminotransferase